jgi:hypothetical protein
MSVLGLYTQAPSMAMADGDGGSWTTWRPSRGVGVGFRDGQGVANGLAMPIFGIATVREDTVVAGGVSRLRGHGGISFTRAVRARRAHETGMWDRGCGLARTAGRGDKGNLPSRVACPCSLLRFPFGRSRGRRAEERDDGWVPLVGEARGNGRGPCWASPRVGRREQRAKQARPRVGPAR